MQLGLDGKKRIWLGWLETPQAVVGPVKLLDLDPQTLVPRTSGGGHGAGWGTATDFSLVCATCAGSCWLTCAAATSERPRPVSLRRRWPRARARRLLTFSTQQSELGSSRPARSPASLQRSDQGVAVRRRDLPRRRASARIRASSDRSPFRPTINPLDYDHYAIYQFSGRGVRAGWARVLRDVLPRPRHEDAPARRRRPRAMTRFLDELARSMARPMPRSRALRLLGGALVSTAVPVVFGGRLSGGEATKGRPTSALRRQTDWLLFARRSSSGRRAPTAAQRRPRHAGRLGGVLLRLLRPA